MEFMASFFQIGYGLPMMQGVQAMRTILFGSFDHMGRNVGVVSAWIGLSWLLSALIVVKQRKEAAKKEEEGKGENVA